MKKKFSITKIKSQNLPFRNPSGIKGLNTEELFTSLEQSLTTASNLLVEKLTKVLESVLAKLSRYDEGSFTSSILSFTKPSMETANEFVHVS